MPARSYKEDMVLFFNKDISLYKSYTKLVNDSLRNIEMEKALAAGVNKLNIGRVRATTMDEYYTDVQKKQFWRYRPFLGNNYVVTEALSKIDWKILDETRVINGYNCQKAAGKTGGRTWFAWFCIDFPFAYGPWKLNGLPGLILEATDEKNRISFVFSRIELYGSGNMALNFPPNMMKTTNKSLNEMIEAYKNDPNAFSAETGVELKVTSNQTVTRAVINNPLEIPDK